MDISMNLEPEVALAAIYGLIVLLTGVFATFIAALRPWRARP